MSSQTITIVAATIGATTGAISLFRQWWSERFQLVFERAVLQYESGAVEQLGRRSAEECAIRSSTSKSKLNYFPPG